MAESGPIETLDGIVEDNRFTIAVVFPAVGAALLLASAAGWLDGRLSWLSFNPWLILGGVAVMRSPLIVGLLPVLDRRLSWALAALVAYTYGIELVGLATGWPYGEFTYEVALGPTAAGVPIALPILFLPLALDGYLLAWLHGDRLGDSRLVRVAAAILAVLAMDLVLDPAAVGLGLWRYVEAGAYHGVPWTNYAGWTLSALVTVGTVELAIDREALDRRVETCAFVLDDLVSFVVLWGVVNLLLGQLVPATVALGLGLALVASERYDRGLLPA